MEKLTSKKAVSKIQPNKLKSIKRFKSTNIKALLFSTIFFTPLLANEVKLDLITTTATGIPTKLRDAPSNASFVTKEQIQKAAPMQMSDVLKQFSSIKIDKDAGLNERPRIFMRGISFGTLLMIDGILLNDLEGEMRILQMLPVQDIDKVEVVRGAFSSLYGTGGTGGVINITTRMPKSLEMSASLGFGSEVINGGAEKNKASGYFSYGDTFFDQRLRVRASYTFQSSGGARRVPAFVGVAPSSSDNLTINGSNAKVGDVAGYIGRSPYTTQSVNVKIEGDISQNDTLSFNVILLGLNVDLESPISYLRDKDNQPVFGYKTNGGSNGIFNPFIGTGWGGKRLEYNLVGHLSYKHFFEESSLEVSLQAVDMTSHFIAGIANDKASNYFNGRGSSLDNYATSSYLNINYNLDITQNQKFLAGLQGRYMTSRNEENITPNFAVNDFYNHYVSLLARDKANAYTVAAFASLQSKWFNSLQTNLALRLDYWESFNLSSIHTTALNPNFQRFGNIRQFFPSPKFAFSYAVLENTILKGSVGLSFRSPNTSELYSHSTVQIANTRLKPEYGMQFDIGINQGTYYKNGVIKLYYFQSDMFDTIIRRGAGTTSDPFQNINGGRARFNGVELELYQPIFTDLALNLNYTYTNARIISNPSNPSLNNKMIAFIPPHMAHVSLYYGNKANTGFFGSLKMNYQSFAFSNINNTNYKPHTFGSVDERVTFDLKIGYGFSNNTSISISALNFTNAQYYDYYKGLGASIYGQISTKFF